MAMTYAVVVCIVLGAWNGLLVSVLGIQPIIATLILMVAGRGISMAITDGQITTVNNPFFSDLASGFVLTAAAGLPRRGRDGAVHRAAHPAYGARHADRGGRHQPRGQPARRRPGPHDHLDGLRLLRTVRRARRPGDRGQHQLGQRQQPRPVDRARRDPRRGHRRHVADGRPLLPGRHLRRRALHRHAGPHHPQHRDPLGGQLPLQGGRGHRRVPPPVAEGARACCACADPEPRPSRRQEPRHERRHRPHRVDLGPGPDLPPAQRATCRSSPRPRCSSASSASAACATTASPTPRCCSACSSTTPSSSCSASG